MKRLLNKWRVYRILCASDLERRMNDHLWYCHLWVSNAETQLGYCKLGTPSYWACKAVLDRELKDKARTGRRLRKARLRGWKLAAKLPSA